MSLDYISCFFQGNLSHLAEILLFPHPLHLISMLQLVHCYVALAQVFTFQGNQIFICAVMALSKTPSQHKVDLGKESVRLNTLVRYKTSTTAHRFVK